MPEVSWKWPWEKTAEQKRDAVLAKQEPDMRGSFPPLPRPVPPKPEAPKPAILKDLVPATEPPFTHVISRKPIAERIHAAAENAVHLLHRLAEQDPSVAEFVNAHLKATEQAQPEQFVAPPKQTAAVKESHMSFKPSSILSDLGHFFIGFFEGVLNSDAGKSLEAGIVSFVKTDIGVLALDAVAYASELAPGTTNDALRAAAVVKLKADLVNAGKDVSKLGESVLNLFIEAAYTYATGTLAGVEASANKA